MTKILLTASNSFISKSILPLLLNQGYEVDTFTKEQLDLTNLEQLQKVLDNKKYDFIINSAISGQGRLLQEDSLQDFKNNCLITENLLYLQDKYGKLIQFLSAAQWDRTKDIINIKEGENLPVPLNNYNLSKYITAQRILNNPKCLGIRIFNCFGPLEKPNRFISSCIRKCLNKETIEIWGDFGVEFDFFYIVDLFTLINYYIQNPPAQYEEINAVYEKKYTLFEIANIIREITNTKDKIWINVDETKDINRIYTGNGQKLEKLNLPTIGLIEGIKRTYEMIKNEY